MPKLDEQLTEIDNFATAEDMDFVMSYGTDLCIDGHFTKEELIKLANKILEVFDEGD